MAGCSTDVPCSMVTGYTLHALSLFLRWLGMQLKPQLVSRRESAHKATAQLLSECSLRPTHIRMNKKGTCKDACNTHATHIHMQHMYPCNTHTHETHIHMQHMQHMYPCNTHTHTASALLPVATGVCHWQWCDRRRSGWQCDHSLCIWQVPSRHAAVHGPHARVPGKFLERDLR